MISHHAALIYGMTLVAAADREMSDAELRTMGEIVRFLPVFRDFDAEQLPATAAACAELLNDETGLERALDLIAAALPDKLRETAYALACEVAASNGHMPQEVLRLIELLRNTLDIDPLAAAAIERGVRARHSTV